MSQPPAVIKPLFPTLLKGKGVFPGDSRVGWPHSYHRWLCGSAPHNHLTPVHFQNQPAREMHANTLNSQALPKPTHHTPGTCL